MAIKVVSVNVWQGGNLLDELLQFLQQQDADIVLLQEVYNGIDPALAPKYRTMQILRQKLGYLYDDFAPAFLDNRAEGNVLQGNAILSRFPVIVSDITFFSEPFSATYVEHPDNFPSCPRNLQHAVLDTPQGNVHVFNTQGPWDLNCDHFGERRQKMSQIVINAVKDKQKVVFAGDTNAKPTNPAMRNIEQYLVSVFGDSVTTSFNLRRKDLVKYPGYATAIVDLMYVSPDVTVITKECPDVDVSDHLPLVATLQF